MCSLAGEKEPAHACPQSDAWPSPPFRSSAGNVCRFAHTRTPLGVIMHFAGEMGHSKPKLPLIAHIEQNWSDFSAGSWGECRHLPSGSRHDCVCHCSEASQHNSRCGSFCHCISQRVILRAMLLHTTTLLSGQRERFGFEKQPLWNPIRKTAFWNLRVILQTTIHPWK